jgi:hypothetical protein
MNTHRIPPIPWQQAGELEEVSIFFHTIDRVHGLALGPVRDLAREIRDRLKDLSRRIHALCALTCRDCRDVCCRRATIWYDFRDLLYLHFAGDGLPEQQIKKVGGGEGNAAGCFHLTDRGCRLSRSERPFVCTWYLCPDQKLADPAVFNFISEQLSEVKMLRNEMETAFCRISACP